MKIAIINDSSPFLEAVISLGDQNSATLGFLPGQAFYDYASKNQIIVASDGNELLGYLLFRISRNVTYIVHLCVSSKHRGSGIAKALMNHLVQETSHTYEIKLRCRRDYGLDNFWQLLGFTPTSETPGRSTKEPTILTVWTRSHKHDTLFDYIAAQNKESTFIAVLDTNIVIDLLDGSSDESKQLKADYLKDIVTYQVAEPIFHEINTQPQKSLREATREFAKQFDVINNSNVTGYETVVTCIRQEFNGTVSHNTEQDIAHIAHAVTAGAIAFVTRDEVWLNTKVSEFIENEYGLRIMSPGEFILSVDELSKQEDYVPSRLAGLNLQYAKMSSTDLKKIGYDFQMSENEENEENLGKLHKRLRLLMADPINNSILLIKNGETIVAVFAYALCEKVLNVKLFRISSSCLSPSIRPTLLTRLAMKLIEIALKHSAELIWVDKSIVNSTEVEKSFLKSGFIKNKNQLSKVILNGVLLKSEFVAKLASINYVHGLDNPSWLSNINSSVQLVPQDIVYIEKHCWPVKLKDIVIPTYIVPIKPSYAIELFDENLSSSNPSLFANERMEPALSIENIYFKSSSLTIPNSPVRILWYVSHDRKLFFDSSIRACSYLDQIDIDWATKLYKRYKRLGVLDWNHILGLAKNDPHQYIACYRFSFTELLPYPIPYADLKEWYKERSGKALVVQSYTEIENKEFIELYQWGKTGERSPMKNNT